MELKELQLKMDELKTLINELNTILTGLECNGAINKINQAKTILDEIRNGSDNLIWDQGKW
jgi:hypothetical protein